MSLLTNWVPSGPPKLQHTAAVNEARALEGENIALRRTLMKLTIQGRDIKRLDEETEAARKLLEQKRRRDALARKQELAEQNIQLQKRLSAARGRDAKCLEAQVETRRRELEEKRRDEAERKKAELRAHNLEMKERLSAARGRDQKNLASITEQKRKALEQKRREDAKRKEEELRAHTEALKRLGRAASGRDQKSLDAEVEAKRKALKEERIEQTERRIKELREQNIELQKRLLAVAASRGHDPDSRGDESCGSRGTGEEHPRTQCTKKSWTREQQSRAKGVQ